MNLDIEQRFIDSNQSVAGVSSLKYIFNIRDWIAPCLDEIKYHTTPHVFLFRRDEDQGKAVMYYKHWSSDPWIPKEGLILLKVYINCTDFTSSILYSINVHYRKCQQDKVIAGNSGHTQTSDNYTVIVLNKEQHSSYNSSIVVAMLLFVENQYEIGIIVRSLGVSGVTRNYLILVWLNQIWKR